VDLDVYHIVEEIWIWIFILKKSYCRRVYSWYYCLCNSIMLPQGYQTCSGTKAW